MSNYSATLHSLRRSEQPASALHRPGETRRAKARHYAHRDALSTPLDQGSAQDSPTRCHGEGASCLPCDSRRPRVIGDTIAKSLRPDVR